MKRKQRFFLFFFVFWMYLLWAPQAAAAGQPAPQKLVLSQKRMTLYVGETKKLVVCKTKPAEASDKVIWKSSRKKIADVSGYGKVTAKRPGKVTIMAVSRKNPSVTSAVLVTVRKAPKKCEKTCTVSGRFYTDTTDAVFLRDFCRIEYHLSNHPNRMVIRSTEDFQEMKRIWRKYSRRNFRKSCLAEYEDMDFDKESLVVLSYTVSPNVCKPEVVSVSTKFDASGKLVGIVDVRSEEDAFYSNPDNIGPAVLRTDTLILQMKKKEEAMIDYFQIR